MKQFDAKIRKERIVYFFFIIFIFSLSLSLFHSLSLSISFSLFFKTLLFYPSLYLFLYSLSCIPFLFCRLFPFWADILKVCEWMGIKNRKERILGSRDIFYCLSLSFSLKKSGKEVLGSGNWFSFSLSFFIHIIVTNHPHCTRFCSTLRPLMDIEKLGYANVEVEEWNSKGTIAVRGIS